MVASWLVGLSVTGHDHSMEHETTSPPLVKQFILSRSGELLPEDWPSRDRMGWHLATHPSDGLPIIGITAACGSQVGWLIGFGVDLEAGLFTDQLRVPVEASDANFASAFENRVYDLGGRFLAVLLTEDASRVYLDPCGSLAAVYAEGFETVCSTTTLLPDAEGSENRALADALDIPNCDNWYPFGLTPRKDARRLEPNHYLDLDAWESIRHWPVSPLVPVENQGDAERLVEEIADTAAAVARHLLEAAPLTASLTAGHDSRMLLAAVQPMRDRITFFTEKYADRTAQIDCQIAARIAAKHGLSHHVIGWENPSEDELGAWLYRTGTCVAGRSWMAVRAARRSSGSGFKLLGLAAEVGRNDYWRLPDIPRAAPAAGEAIAALKLPPAPQVVEGARAWLAEVPVSGWPTTMDMLYLEQRVGCWAGPQFYGHVASKSDIVGWNHRRIIENCLRLPLEMRAGNDLANMLIESRWPELLEWPFNEFVGLPALADRAVRRVRRFFREHPRLGKLVSRGP